MITTLESIAEIKLCNSYEVLLRTASIILRLLLLMIAVDIMSFLL